MGGIQMKSFGLWYQDITNQQENQDIPVPKFCLHVNFWSLEDIKTSDNITTPYLDIGIKIENYHSLENFIFYCPFTLKEDDIIDLSNKLETKNNANIIFNTECDIQTKDNYTIIELTDKSERLLVFPLKQVVGDVYELGVESPETGTKLLFKFKEFLNYINNVNELNNLKVVYIRFRIKNSSLNKQIFFDSEPLNKSFESAFSGTRIIDFKINEKRNIERDIRAKIIVEKQKWITLQNVHFLVMVPSSYDLTSFYNSPMTCRELEENLWDDYLNTRINFNKVHVLAYHWKNSEPKEDFSCLVKINYSKAKRITILAYALSVVALGIISSAIFTALNSVTSKIFLATIFELLLGAVLLILAFVLGKFQK